MAGRGGGGAMLKRGETSGRSAPPPNRPALTGGCRRSCSDQYCGVRLKEGIERTRALFNDGGNTSGAIGTWHGSELDDQGILLCNDKTPDPGATTAKMRVGERVEALCSRIHACCNGLQHRVVDNSPHLYRNIQLAGQKPRKTMLSIIIMILFHLRENLN